MTTDLPTRAHDALRRLHEHGRIASPRLPGVLDERWTGPYHGTHRYTDQEVRAGILFDRGAPVPTDPATLGCLLALLREAEGDPTLYVVPDYPGSRWEVERSDPAAPTLGWGPTEAEALVAALEAVAGVLDA